MSKTKQLVFCSLFTALIAVGAFIKIPVPVVPFTLQYLFTMLAGLILGPRLGTISVTAYMLLGLAGLPIFTEGGGLMYLAKPSCGFLLGLPHPVAPVRIPAEDDRLADRRLTVEVTDRAKTYVIDTAFDPIYGARPLKRYIQSVIETLIAKTVIAGDPLPGSTLVIDAADTPEGFAATIENPAPDVNGK